MLNIFKKVIKKAKNCKTINLVEIVFKTYNVIFQNTIKNKQNKKTVAKFISKFKEKTL